MTTCKKMFVVLPNYSNFSISVDICHVHRDVNGNSYYLNIVFLWFLYVCKGLYEIIGKLLKKVPVLNYFRKFSVTPDIQ